MTAVVSLLFVATIPAANWLLVNVGVLPAVLMVGSALVLRDIMREQGGRRWALGAIAAGAALSFALSAPGLALASVLSSAAPDPAGSRSRRRLPSDRGLT